MAFKLGRLTVTRGISSEMVVSTKFQRFVMESVSRYSAGDWGELSTGDKLANDSAVANGDDRTLGAYVSKELQRKIYILTDADRNFTTVMFPSEY